MATVDAATESHMKGTIAVCPSTPTNMYFRCTTCSVFE